MDTQKLLEERGKTHGDFGDHAAYTQKIKRVMRDGRNWQNLTDVQREGLDMIAHKIGRVLAGNPNFRDHYDDMAGYAKLMADRCQQPAAFDPAAALRGFMNAK